MMGGMLGPLPGGSRALIRITLEKSKYPVEGNDMLSLSPQGLCQLPVRMEVVSGRYAGYYWYERIIAPQKFQIRELTDKQKKTCSVGAGILRSILESANGIDPARDDEEASAIREIEDFGKISGLVFPARLDIDPKPRLRKDGSVAWHNYVRNILPVTDADYQFIMNGGEYISFGPVTGEKK